MIFSSQLMNYVDVLLFLSCQLNSLFIGLRISHTMMFWNFISISHRNSQFTPCCLLGSARVVLVSKFYRLLRLFSSEHLRCSRIVVLVFGHCCSNTEAKIQRMRCYCL